MLNEPTMEQLKALKFDAMARPPRRSATAATGEPDGTTIASACGAGVGRVIGRQHHLAGASDP
jgi:hypothetical protein